MKKSILLAVLLLAFVTSSCAMVYVINPHEKKTQEEPVTEPSCTETDLTCVQVNTSTGTYTIDPSGCVSKAGDAYKAAYNCALLAGAYSHGAKEWNDEYEKWLNSDSEESPDKFNNIDGKAYHDAVNLAEDAPNYV
jgi:hypothetical protein